MNDHETKAAKAVADTPELKELTSAQRERVAASVAISIATKQNESPHAGQHHADAEAAMNEWLEHYYQKGSGMVGGVFHGGLRERYLWDLRAYKHTKDEPHYLETATRLVRDDLRAENVRAELKELPARRAAEAEAEAKRKVAALNPFERVRLLEERLAALEAKA